jgi:hypothetical protein
VPSCAVQSTNLASAWRWYSAGLRSPEVGVQLRDRWTVPRVSCLGICTLLGFAVGNPAGAECPPLSVAQASAGTLCSDGVSICKDRARVICQFLSFLPSCGEIPHGPAGLGPAAMHPIAWQRSQQGRHNSGVRRMPDMYCAQLLPWEGVAASVPARSHLMEAIGSEVAVHGLSNAVLPLPSVLLAVAES